MSFAGRSWWVAVEDIGRLRDGVGVAVPAGRSGAPSPRRWPTRWANCWAATRAPTRPFTTAEAAARFGLGLRVAADVLGRLAVDGRLVRGDFVAAAEVSGAGSEQWCDADVLRMLRRRSLAALRAQVEPVSTAAYGRFLPAWHQVGTADPGTPGVDGLAVGHRSARRRADTGLGAGTAGARPRGSATTQPAMLDELLATGEVTWSGAGSISGSDGWIALHIADSAPLTLAAPAEIEFTDAHRAILDTLAGGGAYFFRQLAQAGIGEATLKAALWELVWAGWVTGDTFAPVRALLGGARRPQAFRARAPNRHRPPRLSRYSVAHAQARTTDPTVAGRWSALPAPEPDSTLRAHLPGRAAVEPPRRADQGRGDRRGRAGRIRHALQGADRVRGRRQVPARLLRRVAGRRPVRRRVDRRPAAQLSRDGVDPERPDIPGGRAGRRRPGQSLRRRTALAARRARRAGAPGHGPGRKAGALVVLVDGELAWFLERGGRSLLTFTDDPARRPRRGRGAGRSGRRPARRVDPGRTHRRDVGTRSRAPAGRSPVADALSDAGFVRTPRGAAAAVTNARR